MAFPGGQLRDDRLGRLPEILAVNDHHFHLVGIEIIEQPRIDADLRIAEIGLAGRPIRCFGESAAAAGGAKTMLYGLRAPLIEGDVFQWRDELELRWDVIGPERAAFRAERTGALRHRPWCF